MGNLKIGEYTYGNVARRGEMNDVNIGKYCSIAKGVVVDCGFGHNITYASTYPFNSNFGIDVPHNVVCKGDINIGNDVWIGEDVMIMSGVTIGDGAIIGARSLVTKDVPPYSIFAGSPAKFLRYRFNPFQIEKLLEIKWWDWGHEKILNNAHLLNCELTNEVILKLLQS